VPHSGAVPNKMKQLETIQARQRECELIEATGIWQEIKTKNQELLSAALNKFAIEELPTLDAAGLNAYFLDLRKECAASMRLTSLFRKMKEGNVQELNLLLEGAREANIEGEEIDLDAGQTQY